MFTKIFILYRLCKKFKDLEETVSPAVVQAFILPIATHNLFDEERLSKNFNELIDSSMEVGIYLCQSQ